jgi:hypothetical protein
MDRKEETGMKDVTQSRVASMLMFGIGAWLMASPLFITVNDAALTNVLIVGGIIAVAGLTQLLWSSSTVPSWIAALAALWLVVSVFVFSASVGFVWSVVLSAIAVFVLAVWDGVEINHAQHTVRHTTV